MKKKCFECTKIKPISGFYKNKSMLDGHVNKCKECTKSCVRANRLKNIDHYRAYDRKRGNRHSCNYLREYRTKHPNKYRAHNIVNNSIRDGILFKEPCEACNTTDSVHAHHDDYLKPLNVRWLCAAHHHQWHAKNGEALNP